MAKTTSVSSMVMSATRSGVASSLPFKRVKNLCPSRLRVQGRCRSSQPMILGSSSSSEARSILKAVKTSSPPNT
jgi:hypothetical protein